MAFTRGLPGPCSGVGLQTGCALGPRQNPICVDTGLINNPGWQFSREEANSRPSQRGQVTARAGASHGADGEAGPQEVRKQAGAASVRGGPGTALGSQKLRAWVLGVPAEGWPPQPLPWRSPCSPPSTPEGGKLTLHAPASVSATWSHVCGSRLWLGERAENWGHASKVGL